MTLDPVFLDRVQTGFTFAFHIIFPSFTIGLSAYVATLAVMWIATGEERFHRLAFFWTKIFAVSFAMGVVSGIVLSYQFGTNWSRFSVVTGNVLGPLMGYEVLTAFFLEATFLGIMLFGWGRVPAWLQALSAIAVAIGTVISAFWILAANSWMQTPAGHEIRGGIAYPADWIAIVFNPSFPYRFAHMVTAAYLTTALVVLAVGARHVMAGRQIAEGRTMMRMAIGMLATLAPLQLFIGDEHGLNTLAHQPIKIAAMEAHWDGSKPGALVLFAWPDEASETNHYQLAIPKAGSLILTHDLNGLFPGLKSVSAADRPPLLPVFFAFRIMVGIGLLMIAIAYVGLWLWWRRRLFETPWFVRFTAQTWWLGFVAVISGWIVTETGRQPWVVTGILRSADATSPIGAGSVAASLLLFVLVYAIVFSMGIYYINRLIARGAEGRAAEPPSPGTSIRTLSSVADAGREILGSRPRT
ncbi:MAG TPA: cytochrome ubiquinol oxidase subunit I [Xanthobacteraceae bacterium]